MPPPKNFPTLGRVAVIRPSARPFVVETPSSPEYEAESVFDLENWITTSQLSISPTGKVKIHLDYSGVNQMG